MRSNPRASKAALRCTHGKFHGFAMKCGGNGVLRCGNVVFAMCSVGFRDPD